MQRLSSPRLGVDQGNVELFSEFENGGEMWTGTGPRLRRKGVAFAQPYGRPPAVQVSVSLWDMDTTAAMRAVIEAENITTLGFDIVFRTWSNTRIARIHANWMSIGDLPFEDDWEIE